MSEANKALFRGIYEQELAKDVEQHPDQFFYGIDDVPKVCAKMTESLANGTANKNSNTIRRTCTKLQIGFSYKEIFRFLNAE